MKGNKNIRALVLMSGGLDSSIAAKMLLEQGIEVVGLYFYTGFCITAQKAKTGRRVEHKSDVSRVCEEMGIRLEILDVSRNYIPMVSRPKFGYGKNMNPCIDCRIFMLNEAKSLLEYYRADFIATGEVLGQRPKSQKSFTQKLIAKETGLEGLLVRPLSAKLLPETIPEKNGWLERKKLGEISGRSRKPQMALAEQWGITEAATPAGGCCFLADKTYSNRFRNLINERKDFFKLDELPPLHQDDVILLGVGRHIHLRKGLKAICGRNEGENRLLEHYFRDRVVLRFPADVAGPTVILDTIEGSNDIVTDKSEWQVHCYSDEKNSNQFILDCGLTVTANELVLAASVVARYGAANQKKSIVNISYFNQDRESISSLEIVVSPITDDSVLQQSLIL